MGEQARGPAAALTSGLDSRPVQCILRPLVDGRMPP